MTFDILIGLIIHAITFFRGKTTCSEPEDPLENSSPDPLPPGLPLQVYNQITETLHVIFTLYSEFKSNQHFSKAGSLAFPTGIWYLVLTQG